jgi:asparagine synthase (glutamine-hydrolysing)
MCGIAGEIRFDGGIARAERVGRMNHALAARGPDGSGLYAQNNLCVGQRRLKIMDLSDRAQQPMVDPELGLGIVFNGAIYNHKQLRKELEGLGYRFFSHGDTEVLIKAYHAWGKEFLHRLNGMFALFLWERDSGRMFLARDRLGIKPLYYSLDDARLQFASTLPALLAGGDIDKRIDPAALNFYMNFHAVVPAPYTIVRGVRKLPPATLMQVTPEGKASFETWWGLPFERTAEEEERSFSDWTDLTLAALRASVDRRLVADVPVGALLSGGVDSSLIVGLMVEAGAKHLKTYSIGFEDVGGEEGNEFRYSNIVAEHFATDHERIYFDSRKLIGRVPEAIAAMSEPMVSHDAVAFYLLSQVVSRDSKVVQSGQGADEVFGGYHWYPPLVDSGDPVGDYARVFRDRDHAEYAEAVNPDLVDADFAGEFIADHFAQPGAEAAVDKALRMDTTIMLVDDPVKRVDNMTMAWGLEARVPFLDHELVELAARIPSRHKIAEGGKHVLKEAARQVIPAAVIDRPKGYFPVPALKYLQGDYLHMVRDVLTGDTAQRRGLFQRPYVEKLLADPEAHITPLRGSKLWQLASLELWLQSHGIQG